MIAGREGECVSVPHLKEDVMHPISKIALHSALAFAAAGLAVSGASAAGYLKLGDIKGDVDASKPGKEWIELESWSFGAAGFQGGTGGIRVAAGDVNADGKTGSAAASPRDAASVPPTGALKSKVPAGQCKLGKRYPGAVLVTPTMRFEMENVMVSSCTRSGQGGESLPMEEISLNYGKVKALPSLPSMGN
jgi:hypothetical protein